MTLAELHDAAQTDAFDAMSLTKLASAYRTILEGIRDHWDATPGSERQRTLYAFEAVELDAGRALLRKGISRDKLTQMADEIVWKAR